MKFKCLIKNIGETDDTKCKEDEINARNEQELHAVYKTLGFEILKIISKEGNPIEENILKEKLLNSKPEFGGPQPGIPIQQNAQYPPQQRMPRAQQKINPHLSYPNELVFNDNGMNFKIIANKLFKKDWINVNDKSEYRVYDKAGNDITGDISMEKLDWIEINKEEPPKKEEKTNEIK